MTWLLVALGLLLGYAVFWWFGRKPVRYRAVLTEVTDRHIPHLLQHLSSGSVLSADRLDGPGFLQLALTDADGSVLRAEFGLPEALWARAAFEKVETKLRAEGFTPVIEAGVSPQVPRFLRLSLSGPSAQLKAQLGAVLGVAAAALGWDADTTYVVTYKGTRRAA
jgi:hypothetical protein